MKLTIYRTGGFAGIREPLLVFDSQTRSASDTAALLEAWRPLYERIAAAARNKPIGADFLLFEIQVQDEHGEEKVELVDDGGETARLLTDFIRNVNGRG